MAQERCYKTEAIVLRKTKLGERDLIVTTIASHGGLVRAVAKGARKPGGSYAAKLELFGCVDLMLAKGRNLDVITDARFAPGFPLHNYGLEQSACAAVVAELLSVICQEGLEHPRLYELSKAAFLALSESDCKTAVSITAAALVKIVSTAGFRPSLDRCQACGSPIPIDSNIGEVFFSVEDGGATCSECVRLSEGYFVDASVLAWTKALLYSRFGEIGNSNIDVSTSFSVLLFLKPWIEHHCGCSLKSLSYLLSCGLF